MENDIIATVDDLVPAGLCATGLKTWARARGWDFKKLVAEGITVKELRDTGCPYAEKVAAQAIRRTKAGGNA